MQPCDIASCWDQHERGINSIGSSILWAKRIQRQVCDGPVGNWAKKRHHASDRLVHSHLLPSVRAPLIFATEGFTNEICNLPTCYGTAHCWTSTYIDDMLRVNWIDVLFCFGMFVFVLVLVLVLWQQQPPTSSAYWLLNTRETGPNSITAGTHRNRCFLQQTNGSEL